MTGKLFLKIGDDEINADDITFSENYNNSLQVFVLKTEIEGNHYELFLKCSGFSFSIVYDIEHEDHKNCVNGLIKHLGCDSWNDLNGKKVEFDIKQLADLKKHR